MACGLFSPSSVARCAQRARGSACGWTGVAAWGRVASQRCRGGMTLGRAMWDGRQGPAAYLTVQHGQRSDAYRAAFDRNSAGTSSMEEVGTMVQRQ